MATRRVNGLIYVPCPGCGRKLGPYTRLTAGIMTCGHCSRVFNVRV
jgi:ribosomal protein L37AE/L43A